jgi:hypothetical protein
MNEILKTVGFVGAAVLIVSIAWLSQPASPVTDAEDVRGERLFPDFNDPLAATSMEIVEFDPETAEVRPFTVAQVDVKGEGKPRWAIPTHENYPADARDQVADAASGVMELRILEVAARNPSDHAYYGVVDPNPNKRKGTTGVGTRVTMKDHRGRVLMSLVIGKEVPDRSGLRYVRKVDEDPVYVVKISTSKLSTKFEDWIEKDLLKLNTWDIKQIQIRDHSVDELRREVIQRGRMTLEYDDTGETKWKLSKDEKFEGGRWVPVAMAPDEELDTAKLDTLKNALDDLKIVDVSRKPPGLSGDLKAEKSFLDNDEALASLISCGFYPAQIGSRVELVSNEGEIRCLVKDGVEYVLRFGEIAGVGSTAAEKKEGKEEGKEEGSSSSGLNRYIFVMAQFNPDIIPKPKLETLPEEKPKPAGDEADKGETPKEDSGADQSSAEKPATEPTQEKAHGQSADEKAGGQSAEEQTGASSTEEETGKPAAEGKQAKTHDEAAGDEKADKESAEKKAEKTAAAGSQPDIEAQRERIKKDNKRKQEEYDEKLEQGKKKVKELNDRFADWYYIISDEVYQKIHLGRDQIVKKKEKKDEKKETEKGEKQPDAAAGKAGAGEQPKEPASPVSEFKKLKQEGPDGSE